MFVFVPIVYEIINKKIFEVFNHASKIWQNQILGSILHKIINEKVLIKKPFAYQKKKFYKSGHNCYITS